VGEREREKRGGVHRQRGVYERETGDSYRTEMREHDRGCVCKVGLCVCRADEGVEDRKMSAR
jgi:hypothetical protein